MNRNNAVAEIVVATKELTVWVYRRWTFQSRSWYSYSQYQPKKCRIS